MKHLKYTIALFFGILLFNITSCDIVEGPYLIDNNTNPVDTNTFVKKVLIEDFTGHRCPNCPAAAEELAALQGFYGDRVIGIAIHPSSQAFSTPSPLTSSSYTYDFRTEFGDDIDNIFEITTVGLPRGMVNRTGFDTGHQLGKDEWSSIVQTELAKAPIFGITLSSDVSNGNGTILVTAEALTNINLDKIQELEDYKIVVCLWTHLIFTDILMNFPNWME